MFPDDYLPPLETKTKDIVSTEREGEEVNSTLVLIKTKPGVEAMDDK